MAQHHRIQLESHLSIGCHPLFIFLHSFLHSICWIYLNLVFAAKAPHHTTNCCNCSTALFWALSDFSRRSGPASDWTSPEKKSKSCLRQFFEVQPCFTSKMTSTSIHTGKLERKYLPVESKWPWKMKCSHKSVSLTQSILSQLASESHWIWSETDCYAGNQHLSTTLELSTTHDYTWLYMIVHVSIHKMFI